MPQTKHHTRPATADHAIDKHEKQGKQGKRTMCVAMNFSHCSCRSNTPNVPAAL